jgi:hypothetical protein
MHALGRQAWAGDCIGLRNPYNESAWCVSTPADRGPGAHRQGGNLQGLRPRAWLSGYLALLLGSACAPAALSPAAAPTVAPTYESTPSYILPTDSWIEVDLGRQLVVLHEAAAIIAEYPASSGVEGYETPTGLYRVQMMEKGPIENVPGVWVADILIFHWGKGIGIHSLPMDADGNVLDATLGLPGSGGCVRVGESARVFEFARLGMHVWVH